LAVSDRSASLSACGSVPIWVRERKYRCWLPGCSGFFLVRSAQRFRHNRVRLP
jgi:hypothetical protein